MEIKCCGVTSFHLMITKYKFINPFIKINIDLLMLIWPKENVWYNTILFIINFTMASSYHY